MQNIERKHIEYLCDLGLKKREALVYLACLRMGQAIVSRISEASGVQRTFVYDILEDLVQKGLASCVIIDEIKYFSVISIEEFERIQKDKLLRFSSIVPELKMNEDTGRTKPKMKLYEGTEGVFLALSDTLNLPIGGEILAYATGTGLYEDEAEKSAEYLKRRIGRKIFCRTIASDTPGTKRFTDNDAEQYRETRLVPSARFGFTNEINIYGNKTLILSLQGELMAVIIESESVAKTQRMIFELAWLGASIAK